MDGFQLFSNWFASRQLPRTRTSAAPQRPLGYPDLSWGEVRYPGSQEPIESDDPVFEGYTEQGVDWKDRGKWGTFNTCANLDYLLTVKNLTSTIR